ncbi:MAG: Mov34/MPN/PAD-1 family protein [Dehalococcoidia bacterium]
MNDIGKITVSSETINEIYIHARNEFPSECCGWILGEKNSNLASIVRQAKNQYSPTNHPSKPDRSSETAYVISGKDLIELNESFEKNIVPKIIYHSHPNGKAYFSETDINNAMSPWGSEPSYPVQQIVIGINEKEIVQAKQFAWDYTSKKFIEINIYLGKKI